MNTIKPTVGMLPMADIAKDLTDNHNIATKTDVANDTNFVGGQPSNQIALSVSAEDRNTVLNSQKLGGLTADQYITNDEATAITNFTNSASDIFAGEIRSLRDELYQMKGELAKNGYLNNYTLYEGFQDLFKIGSGLLTDENKFTYYLSTNMDIANLNMIQTQGNAGLVPDEWIVIYSAADPSALTPELRKLVQVVSYDGYTLIIDQPLPFALNMTYAKIFKIQGQYTRGGFAFSETKNEFPTGDKVKVILIDDYNTKPFLITANQSGYATNFKVPNSAAGALIDFTVRAKKTGAPGSLVCKVYKGSAASASTALTTLVGTSTSTTNTGTTAVFNFAKGDGTYPKLEQSVPEDADSGWYCFVIEAQSADAFNYWEISFSYSSNNQVNGDLQANSTSYAYTAPATISADVVAPYDLYFELTTQQLSINPELPFNEGLYTAEFKLPQPIDVSRARLTVRFNREGNWVVKTPLPGNPTDDLNQIFIEKTAESGDTYSGPDMGFRTDDTVVVGSFIRTLTNAVPYNNSLLTLNEGVYLPAGPQTSVYRVGYRVFLKAWREDWDTTTREFKKVGTPKCIELPVSIAIPDGVKPNISITDRVVFEQEIGLTDGSASPINANCFELQIVWNSFIDFTGISNDSYKTELIGKLNDLVLSFDKTL
jgi:hypothetical protein